MTVPQQPQEVRSPNPAPGAFRRRRKRCPTPRGCRARRPGGPREYAPRTRSRTPRPWRIRCPRCSSRSTRRRTPGSPRPQPSRRRVGCAACGVRIRAPCSWPNSSRRSWSYGRPIAPGARCRRAESRVPGTPPWRPRSRRVPRTRTHDRSRWRYGGHRRAGAAGGVCAGCRDDTLEMLLDAGPAERAGHPPGTFPATNAGCPGRRVPRNSGKSPLRKGRSSGCGAAPRRGRRRTPGRSMLAPRAATRQMDPSGAGSNSSAVRSARSARGEIPADDAPQVAAHERFRSGRHVARVQPRGELPQSAIPHPAGHLGAYLGA